MDLIDTDAAGTHITGIAAEQLLGRRVVEIDIIGVGEVDLDGPQGILPARLLAEEVAVRRRGRPIYGGRIDLGTVIAVEHPDVHFSKRVRILEKLGNEVSRGDRGGYVPVGIEVDLADAAYQCRGGPIELAR